MTSPIYFNVEKARNQLLQEGKVYTIRYPRQKGITMARHGSYFRFKILGKVKVTQVMILDLEYRNLQESKAVLEKYVDQSGFQSVDEWVANVKKEKNAPGEILYLVEALK